ncbi:MAG TPA: PAS domain-containing protein [Candidatus Nanopelagicales bacterium]|nr:PAS domain-containing protein [Candidatus Nanopelagicales bacterium]
MNDPGNVVHFMSNGVPPTRTGWEEREQFFELSIDLLCIAGVDGRFREVNSAWERVLGYSVDELTSRPFIDLVHPEDRDATLSAVSTLAGGEDIACFRNRYRRKDGGYRLLEWRSSTVHARGLIYALARDVTEIEQAEAERRAAHERLRHLLHASRVVLYSARVGGDFGTTFVSENVREQFGHEPRQFIDDARFWLDHVHPEDLEQVHASVQDLLRRGRYAYEYRFRAADGAYRWVHDDATVTRGEGGEPLEIVGSWQDVTERRNAELTIRQQAEALHELSTPLIPITDDVLVMPLIGVLDSRRAAQVLDTLLHGIVERRARAAIIDITGVAVVDTMVADALVRTARAVELLGAEVVLTGIRADVAQTLVTLGADLGRLVTRGTLQAGIRYALRKQTENTGLQGSQRAAR